MATVRVWDALQRTMHWCLLLAVAAAWLSTLILFDWHEAAGWVALAIVLLRVLWGFIGSRYARFGEFVRGPRATLRYLRELRRHAEPRYLGHNPLGGWMVLALLGCVAALGLTGWLYTTDALWGDAIVDYTHQTLAWLLLVLIALHVAGVVFTGRRHRENLVAAMFTGSKAENVEAQPH